METEINLSGYSINQLNNLISPLAVDSNDNAGLESWLGYHCTYLARSALNTLTRLIDFIYQGLFACNWDWKTDFRLQTLLFTYIQERNGQKFESFDTYEKITRLFEALKKRTDRDEGEIKKIGENLALMKPEFDGIPSELQARIFSFLPPSKLPKLLTSSNSECLADEVKSELKKKDISKESIKELESKGSIFSTWQCYNIGSFNTEPQQTLEEHTNSVRSLTQLKDGRLASSSLDKTIRLWSFNQEMRKWDSEVLKGHKDSVDSLIQLKDGRLASSSYDKTIRLWNFNQEIQTWDSEELKGHTNLVLSLIQLKDGRLASGSKDKTIRIWNFNQEMQNWDSEELKGHKDCVRSLIQLKDGRLASGSADQTIRLWNFNQEIQTWDSEELKGHKCWVNSLIQLKDGRLASSSYNKTILLWNYNQEKQTWDSEELKGHTSIVRSLIQLKDGRLASSSEDQTIRLWIFNQEMQRWDSEELKGHKARVESLIQLKDGRLASSSLDNTIRLWGSKAKLE